MWKVPAPAYWPEGKLPDGFKLVPIVPLVKADFSGFDKMQREARERAEAAWAEKRAQRAA